MKNFSWMQHSANVFLYSCVAMAVVGCGGAKLIVDDGRKISDEKLKAVKTYRDAASALRPAIVGTASLNDKDCSNQFELPFEVTSSYFFKDEDVKMAMVRELGVNEFLTVLAADSTVGFEAGDVITEVDGYHSSNTLKMITELRALRDNGRPFKLKFASGNEVSVNPLKVCRGYTVVASPEHKDAQHYHWVNSVHPEEIFRSPLTPDEAMWVVLWTQGLSEVGGTRMKTYAYVVGGVKAVAYVGLTVATVGAAAAAGGAAAAAGASAGAIAGHVVGVAAVGGVVKGVTMAAANKASLSGIDSVASGVFDRADDWAFSNMKKLGMNPRAGISLNAKLVAQGAGNNAFVLDEERLAKMLALLATLPPEPMAPPIAAPTPTAVEVFSVTYPGPDNAEAETEVEVEADAKPENAPSPVPVSAKAENQVPVPE
jgi:hypothetical protein